VASTSKSADETVALDTLVGENSEHALFDLTREPA